MLLEIDDIQNRLDEQFLPLEPMLTGFRLVSTKIAPDDADRLELKLKVVLSEPFKELLLRFNLGEFTIGPIAFCSTGNYLSWLIENNRDDASQHYSWWGSGQRPSDVLLIANSDPYAVLLDNATEAISAFKHGESWNDDTIVVANDFGRFIRGLGTVFLQRSDEGGNEDLADEVSNDVGGGSDNLFWRWLAE